MTPLPHSPERPSSEATRARYRKDSHVKDDRGFLLITFGLLLIPIVIFTALSVDVSSWYSRATELQRAADAGALSGVVWMPDFGKANTQSAPILAKNGFTNGANNISITTAVGETGPTSYKVCVTDNRVRQFFGVVFASPTKMTRCGTAQYNAPLQLGSPLNYYGGNHDSISSQTPPPADAYASTPNNAAFGGKNFCWTNDGTGAHNGFWSRGDGRWYPYPGNTGAAPSDPVCSGGVTAPALPNVPGGGTCRVPGTNGYWYQYNGGYTFPAGWRYYNSNNTYTNCTYGPVIQPIPAAKSPNMWAAIESYGYGHANGDAFSNKGAEYRSTGYWYSVDIPDTGVTNGTVSIQAWDLGYNCELGCRSPEGDTGGQTPVRMRVFKAGALKYDMSALTPVSGCDTGWVTGTANAAYDQRWKEVCALSAVSAGNRFYIQVQSTETTPVGLGGTAADSNVTTGKTGTGVTGYAVRAVAGTFPSACLDHMPQGDVACYGATGSVQPRLSAYGDMEMYNGINSGQPTQFYLADVTPTYGGKTLEISLFDPGDGAGTSWVTVRGPSMSSVDGTMVPSSNCTVESRLYGSTTWNSVALSNGPGGAYPGTCTVQTSGGSASSCDGSGQTNKFNDCWLRFRIPLPSDYGQTGTANWTKCNPSVADPVVNPGSCWWQISYYVGSGTLGDYTTWSAGIVNDPVRLTR